MTEWILSDDKESCPECEAIVNHWKKYFRDGETINWLSIAVLDYLTDFNGQLPGAGGIVEIGKDES